MEYLIIVQREIPLPNGTINHINSHTVTELRLIYSNYNEAQRAAARIIGYNYSENNVDVYVAIVTFVNCKCVRKIIDVLYSKKLLLEDTICGTLNSPIDIVPIVSNITGNATELFNIDNDIPNNDWFVLVLVTNPNYGTITQNGYQLTYTSMDTTNTLVDIVEYKIVNVINGCEKTGLITININ